MADKMLNISCCGKPNVAIYYFSPVAFVGKCTNCGTIIRNNAPVFPLVLKTRTTSPVYSGDETLVARIHELEGELEAARSG